MIRNNVPINIKVKVRINNNATSSNGLVTYAGVVVESPKLEVVPKTLVVRLQNRSIDLY